MYIYTEENTNIAILQVNIMSEDIYFTENTGKAASESDDSVENTTFTKIVPSKKEARCLEDLLYDDDLFDDDKCGITTVPKKKIRCLEDLL